MEPVLSALWRVSLSASLLIVLLLVIRRLFFGKINPRWQYAMWGLVALRLILPFSVESPVSAISVLPPVVDQVEEYFAPPSTENSQPNENYNPQPTIPPEGTDIGATAEKPAPMQATTILFLVWLFGASCILMYMAFVNLRFIRRKRARFPNGEILTKALCGTSVEVWVDESIASPCLAGIFHPRIILTPQAAAPECLRYVLLHELCHYTRHDNLFVLIRNLLCAVYWFNPLVWVAASVSRINCELACDGAVLKGLQAEEAIFYGETLLSLIRRKSTPSILATTTTMSGGKNTMKTRIRLIAKRPRPLIITGVCVLLLTVIAVVITCTTPVTPPVPQPVFDQSDKDNGFTAYAAEASTAKLPVPAGATVFANVVGVAVDKETEEFIPGARISLNGETVVVTDQRGRFRITNVPSDTYDWTVQAESYQDSSYLNYFVDGLDGTKFFSFYLSAEEPVTVDNAALMGGYVSDEGTIIDTPPAFESIHGVKRTMQDTFHGVLLGDLEYTRAWDGEQLDISRIGEEFTSDDVPMTVTKFAVVDMDQDNTVEAILQVDTESNTVGFVILRYSRDNPYSMFNGKLTSYAMYNRGFSDLKQDGTFGFSGGASNNGFGKFSFTHEYYTEKLAYYEPDDERNTNYFVNNEPATKWEYLTAEQLHNREKSAIWYDFTEEEIKKCFW